ncbi:MAG: SecDF P1 head subdomain-containing protein, partial [Acidimicrobiales bacterium]
MSRTFRWRALVAAGVLIGAVAIVVARPARLGLDLQGGTQIVLEARGAEGDTVSGTLEVLRRRVDALGVAEPTLQRSGDRRIIIELPGVADPEAALAVIGRTAQLAFHPVVAAEGEALADERGIPLRVAPARVTGEAVGTAKAALGGAFGGEWQVEVELRGDASREWASMTGAAACAPAGDPARRIAIVLD